MRPTPEVAQLRAPPEILLEDGAILAKSAMLQAKLKRRAGVPESVLRARPTPRDPALERDRAPQ